MAMAMGCFFPSFISDLHASFAYGTEGKARKRQGKSSHGKKLTFLVRHSIGTGKVVSFSSSLG